MNARKYLIGCLDFLGIVGFLLIFVAPSQLTMLLAAGCIWGILTSWGL